MRKIISITIVIIMFLCVGWLSNQEHTYTREVIVYSIECNTVTVVDDNYTVWRYNTNDIDISLIGKTITVVMNDNYTDSNIKDDKIIDIIID